MSSILPETLLTPLTDAPTGDAKSSNGLRLYSHPICPFAQRSWLALKLKQVPHEFVYVPLGTEKPAWYTAKVNPRGTVPTLEDTSKGQKVFESAIIAEYVEDRFANQGESLLPKDAYLRAAVRLFMEEGGKFIVPFYQTLKSQDAKDTEQKKTALLESLRRTNELLKEQSDGPFFLGAQVSLADVHIAPFLYRAYLLLNYYRNINIFEDASGTDRLVALLKAFAEKSEWQATDPGYDYLVKLYETYGGKPTLDHPKLPLPIAEL